MRKEELNRHCHRPHDRSRDLFGNSPQCLQRQKLLKKFANDWNLVRQSKRMCHGGIRTCATVTVGTRLKKILHRV